jgi:hypothetical protein
MVSTISSKNLILCTNNNKKLLNLPLEEEKMKKTLNKIKIPIYKKIHKLKINIYLIFNLQMKPKKKY